MDIPINYVAVLASTVSAVVLGFLWFGPLFGKAWMKSLGITEEQANSAKNDPKMRAAMNKSYAIMAVTAFIMMFTLAHNVIFGSAYLQMTGIASGLQAGFWNWLGFMVPISLGGVLWENKPWKWWIITAGYYLVALLVGGVILSLWV